MCALKKHRFTLIAMGFCILILLLLILFIRGTSRQRSHMELPDDSAGLPGGEEEPDSSSSLSIVEITPETVQQAVATMARPAAYVRTVRITTHWSGGSRTVDVQTAVREPYTRTDVQTAGGSTRHLLTDGERTCIWYDEEQEWAEFPAGGFSEDEEQRILTYEDLLELPVEEIAAAVYRDYKDLSCICVLTAADGEGYDTAYWISVDTGLLVAAVTRQDGETVYEMESLTMDTAVDESRFLLPDGSALA